MLKRKIYDQLLNWKKISNGQTAMLIDGARRVGKSYIAELFARQEYKSHIIIDFGNAPQDILDLFQHESSDLDSFLPNYPHSTQPHCINGILSSYSMKSSSFQERDSL